MSNAIMPVSLNYGRNGRFVCDLDPQQIVEYRSAPRSLPQLPDDLRTALAMPLEFPPLGQLFIPGDQVVIALDRHTPAAPQLLRAIWDVLAAREVDPESVQVLQPAALDGVPLVDPRGELPEDIRNDVRWSVHDPTDRTRQAYLATTARGERIYLAREVADADVVLSVGPIAYDALLGYRGTSSVFYPGLANTEAVIRARGEGHSELGPDDDRPLRQSVDEIAWLLGTQFSVQVVPSVGAGAAAVLAGAVDPVFRRGRQVLDELWRVRLDERADMVVLSIDADSAGHGWDQLGSALATARNLVARKGKIVVLSEIDSEPGDGLKLLRENPSPRSALQPIRKQAPVDLIPATQIASAADWASVYLLSKLPSDLVDDLFMTPLENEREAARLLRTGERCVIIESAQHAWGEVRAN